MASSLINPVEEMRSLQRVMDAYADYERAAEADVRRWERAYNFLRTPQKALLSNLPAKYAAIRRCAAANYSFIHRMLETFEAPFPPEECNSSIPNTSNPNLSQKSDLLSQRSQDFPSQNKENPENLREINDLVQGKNRVLSTIPTAVGDNVRENKTKDENTGTSVASKMNVGREFNEVKMEEHRNPKVEWTGTESRTETRTGTGTENGTETKTATMSGVDSMNEVSCGGGGSTRNFDDKKFLNVKQEIPNCCDGNGIVGQSNCIERRSLSGFSQLETTGGQVACVERPGNGPMWSGHVAKQSVTAKINDTETVTKSVTETEGLKASVDMGNGPWNSTDNGEGDTNKGDVHKGDMNKDEMTKADTNKSFGSLWPGEGWFRPSPFYRVPPVDVDKVRCILRNVVRDWGAEGASERQQCYDPIISELNRLFPFRSTQNSIPNVLVPGAGLARLACEISRAGFVCQGNEFSYYMLIWASFILNNSREREEWMLYPWIHSSCNVVSDKDQIRGVAIPDLLPCESGITEGFSMCAGDFVEVYGHPDQAGMWDCVVTCFFIDTAHNVVDYIEVIAKALRPGGVWINLGPLLYHFASAHDSGPGEEWSVELSLEDVKRVSSHFGFLLLREETVNTTYTANGRSMMQNQYKCAFWTMVKTVQPTAVSPNVKHL